MNVMLVAPQGLSFLQVFSFPLSFQELAHVLTSIPVRVSSKKQHSARSQKSPSKLQSCNADPAVLRRAREIARNTFDLSDAEVDALLSGAPTSSTPRDSQVLYVVTGLSWHFYLAPSISLQHDQEATLASRIHRIIKSQVRGMCAL